jgi:hypothetical protein
VAYTSVAVQTPTRAGLTPTFTAADGTNGNAVSNNGRTILRFKNTSGSSVTATVNYSTVVDGTAITGGKAITIPATTGDVTTGVWTTDYTQSDGTLHIDWSSGRASRSALSPSDLAPLRAPRVDYSARGVRRAQFSSPREPPL